MKGFGGRTAIVTGSAQGIGAAIATKLAAEGATVVVADVNESAAATTASGLGDPSFAWPVDVGDEAAVAELHQAVLAHRPDRHPREQRRHRALH